MIDGVARQFRMKLPEKEFVAMVAVGVKFFVVTVFRCRVFKWSLFFYHAHVPRLNDCLLKLIEDCFIFRGQHAEDCGQLQVHVQQELVGAQAQVDVVYKFVHHVVRLKFDNFKFWSTPKLRSIFKLQQDLKSDHSNPETFEILTFWRSYFKWSSFQRPQPFENQTIQNPDIFVQISNSFWQNGGHLFILHMLRLPDFRFHINLFLTILNPHLSGFQIPTVV